MSFQKSLVNEENRKEDPAQDPVKALAGKLLEYSEKKEQRSETTDQIFRLLGKLDEDDRKGLMKDAEFRKMIESLAEEEHAAPKGRRPGEVYGEGFAKQAVPWTMADLAEFHPDGSPKTPWVEFISPVTETVWWNGLPMTFFARRRHRVPEVFYGVLMDTLQQQELNQEHAEYLMRQRDDVSDPSIISMQSRRVRASADKGHYLPGGGNISDLNQAADVKRMEGKNA